MSKPVVAYIAGFTAPPGKTMGHAGAIISGSSGTAQAKKDALEAVGVRVGTTPTEVAELAADTAARDRRRGEQLRPGRSQGGSHGRPSRSPAAFRRPSASRSKSSPTARAPRSSATAPPR